MNNERPYNLQIVELTLIKNDTETLMALQHAHNEAIFHLGFLPYYALFCQSFLDYCDSNGTSITFKQESGIKFSDARAALKLFYEKYKRYEKRILAVDAIQNEEFKSKLRIPLLKRLNIHNNLGIYFDREHHILLNTQYANYILQNTNKIADRDSTFKLGKDLGSIIGLVHTALQEIIPTINLTINRINMPVLYKDLNTNRNFNRFEHLENGKELTLRMLHLISAINFVRFVIRKIVPVDNPWQLRAKYFTLYYVMKNLNKIQTEYKNEAALVELLAPTQNESLLNADFRSCMAHYGLTNKGQCAIKERCFDFNNPMFGLVESCFNMSYYDFNIEIDNAIDKISDILAEILSFNFSSYNTF